MVFHQDVPAYKNVLSLGKLRNLQCEVLRYILYSPEFDSSGFHFASKCKIFLAEQHFSFNQEMVAAADVYAHNK